MIQQMENHRQIVENSNDHIHKQINSRYTRDHAAETMHQMVSYSVKYLRIHIDKKLNFSKQVNHAVNKVKAARTTLYPRSSTQETQSLSTRSCLCTKHTSD